MQHHFFFLNGGLNDKFTGIENAAFKRYKLFTQYLNIHPIYLCMYYDLELPKHLQSLKASGHISDDFRYVNLYEYFLRDCEVQRKLSPELDRKQSTSIISHGGKKRLARVYDMQTKLLSFVNFYGEDGERYRMDKYDEQGFLSISIMFAPNGKRHSANYFRQDGSLALSWHYTDNEGVHKVHHIVLFDKQSIPIESFINEDQLYTYLLRYYLSRFSHRDQLNLIIDRHVRFAKSLTDGSLAAKINYLHVLHNIHFEDPTNKESKLSSAYGYLNDLAHFGGVVTLTPQQTADIQQRFGDYGKLHCIPHAIDVLPQKVDYAKRQKNRVIAVGRLHPQKNHKKMIRIFAQVVAEIPDAQLDIFGKGELENSLKAQIEALNLQNNVHLRGFSNNIAEEFESAQCSLLTSCYEGQPLVVLESLAFGCPVISSDICYGPASMIEEGKNGFLLPVEEEKAFAQHIIRLLQDHHLAQRLSEGAYQSVIRFTPENIAPLWAKMMEKLGWQIKSPC